MLYLSIVSLTEVEKTLSNSYWALRAVWEHMRDYGSDTKSKCITSHPDWHRKIVMYCMSR